MTPLNPMRLGAAGCVPLGDTHQTATVNGVLWVVCGRCGAVKQPNRH